MTTVKSFGAAMLNHGNPPDLWVAEINHKEEDGCHIFTSDEIHGLLVFSDKKEKAIAMLPDVIAELARRNHNFRCSTVELGNSTSTGPGHRADNPKFAVIKKVAG